MEVISDSLNRVEGVGLWALFLQADFLIKTVLIGLLAASVWSWAVVVQKHMQLRRLHLLADEFEEMFWSGHPLEKLYKPLTQGEAHPMAMLFVVGMREWKRAQNLDVGWQALDRHIERSLSVALAKETDPLQKRLLSLATIGATAPFVGLFGTVWGIMNSFQAIANTSDTSLAVVAPGIAEALFATALGLFVAIPAVVFYNRFNERVGEYVARLELFCDEFTGIVFYENTER